MFFFNGFGSIAPYLIYLSLIWIYILFGVLEKNRLAEQPRQAKQHVAIANIKQVRADSGNIYYFGNNHTLKKCFKSIFYFNPDVNILAQFFEKLPVTGLYCCRYGFLQYYSWRGPPQTSLL
jgi:hypothetical protein